MKRRPREAFHPACEQLEDRSLLSILTPVQIGHAYGVDSITFSPGGPTLRGDGPGQNFPTLLRRERSPWGEAEPSPDDTRIRE
jgi:hypothetical protein